MSLDFTHPPILETERLRLDPVIASDGEPLYAIMGDPGMMAGWAVAEVDDPDFAARVVAQQVEDMVARRAVHWTLRALADGRILGACDLSQIERRHRRAEIGFLFGRDAWVQGYGQEALRSVVAYAAASGLRKLAARTHLGARRSESLLENLGFAEEGLLRGHILKDGERRDCRLFGLLL